MGLASMRGYRALLSELRPDHLLNLCVVLTSIRLLSPRYNMQRSSLHAKHIPTFLARGNLRRYTTSPFSFSAFTDTASIPVVRDALVPIVIEQTVSPCREEGRDGRGRC